MSFAYLVTKPKDLEKINSRELGELLWWSYHLGVTPEKIVTTINEVGEATIEVTRHIREKQ